jgi:hypothetical protein
MRHTTYWLLACAATLIAGGCSKTEYPGLGNEDSLLVTTLKQPWDTAHPQPGMGAALMDTLRIRAERDAAKLRRLTPMQVVNVYDGFRHLRNGKTTEAQLDSFLLAQKITRDELHAVLAEGDRLGWAGSEVK